MGQPVRVQVSLPAPSAFAYATARLVSEKPTEDVELEKRMPRCNDFAEASSISKNNESGLLFIMFYVYILQSKNFPEHFYVGYTNDLQRRLQDHNNGCSIHTNKFRPWNICGYLAFNSKTKAQKFEKFLKSGNGRIFQKKFF